MLPRPQARVRDRARQASIAGANACSTTLLNGYRTTLTWTLDHPALILLVFVGTVALNVFLISIIPTGFFPQQDTGVMTGGMQGPQDTSFYAMSAAVQQAVDIIKSDPGVANVMSFTGGQGATNGGFTFIALKTLGKGPGDREDSVRRQSSSTVSAPSSPASPVPRPSFRPSRTSASAAASPAPSTNTPSPVKPRPTSSNTAPPLLSALRKAPGFQDANTDQQNDGLQMLLNYDRPTAARLGITPRLLDSTLYDAFGQAEVSTIYTQLNQYYVVMEVAPKYWQSPAGLKDTYLIQNSGGGAIPLDAVATYQPSTSPLAVNHTGLFPSVTVNFNLGPGVSLGQATQEIAGIQQEARLPRSLSTASSPEPSRPSRPRSPSEKYLIITAIARRLHRPRHPLRVAHPPHHHPLHPPLRLRRRHDRPHPHRH